MSTPPGFTLFVDESGDEGTEKVRPLDEDGASEYFVMAGLLIRTSRIPELNRMMESLRTELGLATDEEIHYRDLSDEGNPSSSSASPISGSA